MLRGRGFYIWAKIRGPQEGPYILVRFPADYVTQHKIYRNQGGIFTQSAAANFQWKGSRLVRTALPADLIAGGLPDLELPPAQVLTTSDMTPPPLTMDLSDNERRSKSEK